MYYIYHVPNEKVGCTNNLKVRVETVQGLDPSEYEVLATSEDKLIASHLEAYYKGVHGFEIDETYYRNEDCEILTLKKSNMIELKVDPSGKWISARDINKSTFLEDTKEGIAFNIDGERLVFVDSADIQDLASKSRTKGIYFAKRAIVKRYKEIANESKTSPCTHTNTIKEFQQIRDWASNKGIYDKGDPKTQLVKLIEEQGEFAKAILKDDQPEIIDALGDMLVVLINLSELSGYKLEDCLQSAYDIIKKRTGKMINGTFVKSESLSDDRMNIIGQNGNDGLHYEETL